MKPAARLLLTPLLLLVLAISAGAADRPEIRVGSILDFSPFCFTDNEGRTGGFGIDLLKAVADKTGLRVRVTPAPWDSTWSGLIAGRFDVLPVVARTPGRESQVDFSLPHSETFDAFFVRSGRPPIKDIAAAAGRKIVVLRSDAAHHQLLERKFTGLIVPVDTISQGLRLIAAGENDALLCSRLIATREMEEHGIRGITAGPPIPDYKRVFSFAVRKGNAELLEKLNRGLAIVEASGEYEKLYRKWLGPEKPPPRWQTPFWRLIGILGVLVLIAVTVVVARKAFQTDRRQWQALTPQRPGALSAFWRYALAVVAVAAGYMLRIGLEAWVGPGLPLFITFYPAVMMTALLGGIRPGLLATVLAAVIADIWLLSPPGQSVAASPSDLVAVALFCCMGLFMTAIVELQRRNRAKAEAFDREEALREIHREKEFLAGLLETAELPFAVGYPDGRIGMLNSAFERLTGYTAAELRALDWSVALTPPEWHDHEREMVEELGRTGQPVRYEKEYLRKDGTRVPVELFVNVRTDAAGRPEFFYAFITDITERRAAGKELQESEERFRTLYEKAPLGIARIDSHTGRFLQLNTRYCEILGRSETEALQLDFQTVTHPDDLAEDLANMQLLREGRIRSFSLDKRCVRPDGALAWVNLTVVPEWAEGAPPSCHIAMVADITARKEAESSLRAQADELKRSRQAALNLARDATAARRQTEEAAAALRESEALLRALTDNSPDAIYVKDTASRWIMANPAVLRIIGKSAAEALGKTDEELYADPEIGRAILANDRHVLESGEPEEFEETADTPEGRRTYMSVKAPRRDAAGKIIGLIGISRDITERKRAEEALRDSEARHRSLFEHMLNGLAYCQMLFDGDGQPEDFVYLAVNDSFGKLTGLTDVIGNRVTQVIPRIKESNPELFEIYGRVALTGNPERFDIDFEPLSLNLSVSVYCPQKGYFVVIFDDITERKRAEEALARAHEQTEADRRRLGAILETSPVGIVLIEADTGRFSLVNQRASEIYGIDYSGFDLETHVAGVKVLQPDGTPFPIEELPVSRAFRGEEVHNVEMTIVRPDGVRVPLSVYAAPLRDGEGKVTTAVIVFDDITERKQAEEKQLESQEMLTLAANAGQVGMFALDLHSNELRWTQQHEIIFGYEPTTTTTTTKRTYGDWADRVHPEDLPTVEERMRQAMAARVPFLVEYRVVWPDGSVHWVNVASQYYFDDSGRCTRLTGAVTDITERKRAEAALQESEEQFRALAETIPNLAWWANGDGYITWYNRRWYDYTGTTPEQMEGWGWQSVHDPEVLPQVVEQWKESIATGKPFDMVFPLRGADGIFRPFLTRIIPVFDQDGRIARWFGTNTDISEQKYAEEALKKAHMELAIQMEERVRELREKEVLLKEVHHRVKNNLQVISSLVGMQADATDDTALREVLQDVTFRVRSMALVHEKLYRSENLSRIDFAEYVKSLLTYLWRAHGAAAENVRLLFDLEPVSLPVNTAAPCGLILNELAGNALKHAFPGRNAGEVTVSLRATDGHVLLSVGDNGVGLPEGMEWRRASSLGLRLVQMLAGQLRADVTVGSGGRGTRFDISFRHEAVKEGETP